VVAVVTTLDAPAPSCWLCQAPDVIRAEGEQRFVCRRCLASMARIADDPYSVPVTVRERLLARSLDVVDIVGGTWRWTSQWPSTGDARLMRGGAA
jgi:hypothetical protein